MHKQLNCSKLRNFVIISIFRFVEFDLSFPETVILVDDAAVNTGPEWEHFKKKMPIRAAPSWSSPDGMSNQLHGKTTRLKKS